MSRVEIRPSLPSMLGKGGELNKLVRKNWREHLVQLALVKNTVLWVNPKFSSTLFDLQVGKPTLLGMFVRGDFAQRPMNLQDGQFSGETWHSHKRSVLLERRVISDYEGRPYRDIDIKGIGVCRERDTKRLGDIIDPEDPDNYRGLLNRQVAEHDQEMSERFLSLGIRTSRTIAIIGLEQLIYEGKIVPVEHVLRKCGILLEFKPVLQLRAFGTKARVNDIDYTDRIDLSEEKLLVDDAKRLVSQELEMNKMMSNKAYLEWFAKTLGKNVGLMHRNGWTHEYLTPHNLTLDCRIVDLDSVERLERREQSHKDFLDASLTLSGFIHHFSKITRGIYHLSGEFPRLYEESYGKTFSLQEQENYFRKLRV